MSKARPERRVQEFDAVRAELHDLRQRYAEVYEHAPLGFLRFDRDGCIHDANSTAVNILETTTEALAHQSLTHYLIDQDIVRFRRHLEQVWRGEGRHTCQLQLKTRTPRRIQLDTARSRSQANYCFASMKDISARHDAETRAANSERQLRLLFENATDYAIFMMDSAGFITDWNIGAERILGYSEQEIIGRPGAVIFTPEDKAAGAVEVELATAREHHSANDERWHVRKDGSRFWASGIMIALLDENDTVVGYAKILRDFTRRKLALAEREELLRQLEREHAQLQAIVHQMPAALMLFDADGTLVLHNPPAAKLLGDIRDGERLDAMHKRYAVFRADGTPYAPEERPLARALRGKTVVDEEVDYHRADGQRLWMSVSVAPIYDRSGAIVGGVAMAADVSDRRYLQSETLKASKLESLGILAGGIAHDFNNLLTGVLGNLYLTHLTLEPQHKAHETLTEAENACRRAASLTQRLLTFSTGGAPIKRRLDPTPLLREAVDFAVRGVGLRATVDISDGLWPIDADEGQIVQVLNNLIINAQQAMPSGGNLYVRAANEHLTEPGHIPLERGCYLRIEVADEGVGIPPEERSKIFDPFFTTKPKGSGLGLTSAYAIVQKHGGYIGVAPRTPKGTVFTVYLPTVRSEQEHAAEGDPAEHPARVLVMDDESVIRRFLERVFKHLGYDVVAVEEGGRAVEEYRAALEARRPFTVVMLDLTVPNGMGGKEAIAQLRAIDPNVCAIVSSGYSNDPVMARFRDYGFCATISKPYQIDELRTKIAQILPAQRTDHR